MDTEKIKVKYPIIVEGKYDKNTLLSVIDGSVIVTGGFSVFNNKELSALIARLSKKDKIVLLTDSDGGGRQIRSFIEGCADKSNIINLYIPKIEGKEKRKKKGGKAGLLGVEGMTPEIIRKIFAPVAYTANTSGVPDAPGERKVTKTDFYLDGLSGGSNSAEKRKKLAKYYSLPDDMSAPALLDAVNLIGAYDTYKDALSDIEKSEKSEE